MPVVDFFIDAQGKDAALVPGRTGKGGRFRVLHAELRQARHLTDPEIAQISNLQ